MRTNPFGISTSFLVSPKSLLSYFFQYLLSQQIINFFMIMLSNNPFTECTCENNSILQLNQCKILDTLSRSMEIKNIPNTPNREAERIGTRRGRSPLADLHVAIVYWPVTSHHDSYIIFTEHRDCIFTFRDLRQS